MEQFTHAPTEAVVEEMSALKDIGDRRLTVRLLAVMYELALRSGVTPRTIADRSFIATCEDGKWRESVSVALREATGRT